MEIGALNQFIKKAMDYYDNQKIKYLNEISTQDVSFDFDTTEITFNFGDNESKTYDYEMIGYFDNQAKIWIWSWVVTDIKSSESKLSRELLQYGLKLEPGSNSLDHFIIKGLLLNSRTIILEQTQLDINLAIYSYLVRDKIKFIYPRRRYLDQNKKTYVTFYYFIK